MLKFFKNNNLRYFS